RRAGERDVRLGNAADTGMQHTRRDLVIAELGQRLDDRFDRTLHVALDDERKLLTARGGLQVRHHLLDRAAAAASRTRRRKIAALTLTVFGDLAGTRLVLDDRKAIARFRRALETENLDRHRRSGLRHLLTLIVDQRAHAAPFRTGDDDVATLQRAALHEHGRDRAAALVELGLDDDAFGRTIRIGLEIEKFGL